MISEADSYNCYEFSDYFKIIHQSNIKNKKIKIGKKVREGFSYSSNTNINWMEQKYFQKWMKEYLKKNKIV